MELRTKNLTAVVAAIHVADAGSFAHASRTLGLSTSATSKAISRLEEDLGVKLFQRTTRSVSLTPEGERYIEGARPLLIELDALTAEITDSLTTPRGSLRVSVPAAFGRMVLVPRISEFTSRFPEIELELSLEDRSVDLAAERIDVAVRAGPLPDSANLIGRKLFDDPLITCAAPAYLDRHGTPKTPDDLDRHNCLNFRNRRTGRAVPWVYLSGERRLESGLLTIDDGEAVGRAAIAGAGISQMPGFMAREALVSGALKEVLQEYRPAETSFTAIYLDRRLVSPRIRAFIDFLVGEFSVDRRLPSS